MAKIYQSIRELVGHTPLVELTNYEKAHNLQARILVKLEYFNPNQSVKDRIALHMIEQAEADGRLKPGDTIIELTSGNTGIGVASIAASKGYKFRLVVQDNVSRERFQVIHAFGGETQNLSEVPVLAQTLAETDWDFVAALKAYKEKVLPLEEHAFFVNQMENPDNPGAHEKTTGPEIWEDTDGEVGIYVASVGTGGTVSGAGKYLKSKNPDIQVVAVQPTPDSVATPDNPDAEEITGVHIFEGDHIRPETIPENFDRTIHDETIAASTQQAYEVVREVARREGILLGTSSGAAIYAATILARRPRNAGKLIVAIAPDTGLRYLTTNLYKV